MKTLYAVIILSLVLLVAGGFALVLGQRPDTSRTELIIMDFIIESQSLKADGTFPSKYTCDGDRTLSPALRIMNPPAGTQSFALIMDDPDIPETVKQRLGTDVFVHWVLFNIPAGTREIAECAKVGTAGANTAGANVYTGPCPPPEYEPTEHRYIFRLLALDTLLELPEGASKEEVLAAAEGHSLGEAILIGRYDRANR